MQQADKPFNLPFEIKQGLAEWRVEDQDGYCICSRPSQEHAQRFLNKLNASLRQRPQTDPKYYMKLGKFTRAVTHDTGVTILQITPIRKTIVSVALDRDELNKLAAPIKSTSAGVVGTWGEYGKIIDRLEHELWQSLQE